MCRKRNNLVLVNADVLIAKYLPGNSLQNKAGVIFCVFLANRGESEANAKLDAKP